MKRTMLAVCALLLLAVACSKQGDTKPGVPAKDSANKYAVNFDVSGFDITSGDFDGRQSAVNGRAAAFDSSQKVINHLYYYVFSGNSVTPFHTIHRVAGDPNFFKIQDSLPAGPYRITVLASHDALAIFSAGQILVPTPGGDLFGRSYTLNVTGQLNQAVPLQRLVNKIRFIVTDQMPTNALRVSLSYRRTPGVNGQNGLNYDATIPSEGSATPSIFLPVKPEELGQANFTRELYLLSEDSSIFTLNVLVQDQQQHQIVFKIANNIPAYRNKMVTIRAALFGGFPSDSGVHVTLPLDTTFKDNGTFSL